MAAPNRPRSGAKTRLDARTSKKNVSLNKAEQKQQMAARKKALGAIDTKLKVFAKAQKDTEAALDSHAKTEARILQLEKEMEERRVELEKLIKAKQEEQRNLARFGKFAVKQAQEMYAEVRVDGFDPPQPPKPPSGPAALWLGAFWAVMIAQMLKSRSTIKKLD